MPGGVVFLVCIPTANYEYDLLFGRASSKCKKQDSLENFDLRIRNIHNKPNLLSMISDSREILNHGVKKRIRANLCQSRTYGNISFPIGVESHNSTFISMEMVS